MHLVSSVKCHWHTPHVDFVFLFEVEVQQNLNDTFSGVCEMKRYDLRKYIIRACTELKKLQSDQAYTM